MSSEPKVLHLPAARSRAPLAAYQLGSSATPDETRRFVAIVSAERTVMAALKCERRGFFHSDFIAKVVNDSDDELACSVTGWTHRGSVPLEPDYFWIKPQSVAQVPIRAPFRFPYRLRSIALHMQSATLRATAEADVPPPPALRLGAVLAGFSAALAGALFAWHAAVPNITAYTMPSRAVAGERVAAEYAYSGVGTGEYSVTRDDQQIAGGVLPARHGEFAFTTASAPGTYRVDFSVVGSLGTRKRELVLQTLAASASSSVSIGALQPDPSVVRGGDHITVRYVAQAESGTVTLYDASGIALQRVPYDQQGLSTLLAPKVDVPTQYRVELAVSQGAQSARASAGLLVLPSADADQPAPPPMLTARELFNMPRAVVSASTFAVRLLAHPDDLRLTLETASGTPLQVQPVGENTSLVYFRAPNISGDATYLMVASFSAGDSDQVLLQRVLVRTAPGGPP